MKISLFKPFIQSLERESLLESFDSGWWVSGPKVKEFEDNFAKYLGVKHVIGVNSCTSAIHISLEILADVLKANVEKPKIYTPSLSFISPFASACTLGKPVLVDIESKTFAMQLPSKIDEYSIVMPMHYGGNPVDVVQLRKNIPESCLILEDAAHACGASYQNGIKVG